MNHKLSAWIDYAAVCQRQRKVSKSNLVPLAQWIDHSEPYMVKSKTIWPHHIWRRFVVANPAVEVCPSYWRGESVFACVVNWITLHQPVSAKWSGSGILCSEKKKKNGCFLCSYKYHVSQGSELTVVFLLALGKWWTSVITGKFALFGRKPVLLNQVVSFVVCMSFLYYV